MTHTGKLVPLGPARVAYRARRPFVGSLVVLVGFTAWMVAPMKATRLAGADTVGSLQAQIAATEAQVTAAAVHIHTLAERYDQASLAANHFAQQVVADNIRVEAQKNQVAVAQTALRQEAVLAYMDGTVATLTPTEQAANTDPAVREEYLQIASGTMFDVVDRYRLEQRELQSAETLVQHEEGQAKTEAAAADQARQAALAAANAAQAQLNQLQAKLIQAQQAAAAEAAAQAAAAQAAAAQAAAAQASAAQAAARQAAAAQASAAQASARPAAAPQALPQATTAPSSQTSVPRAAPPPTQGAPVNNGLVAAVRTLVSPPAPTPAPVPAPAPATTAPPTASGGGGAGGVWLALRECESSDNYAENTGNGFYGAYQFTQATWSGLGYPGRPDLEPPAMQDAAAQKLQAEAGWGQWPACSAALGLT